MNLEMRMAEIKRKQLVFQHAMGLQIATMSGEDMYRVGEMYLFKAIEEVVELRKEFPSGFNKWEKNKKPPEYDKIVVRILEEFADVQLFLMNFTIAFGIGFEEIVLAMEKVQENNMKLLEERQKKHAAENL